MPDIASAVLSASRRSDGVPTGKANKSRIALSQIQYRPTGSAVQRIGSPCLGSDRSSGGRFCRMTAASCRAASGDNRNRWLATTRQPATPANKPSTALCKTGEW
jgi:hypothetical protein